MSRQRTRPSRTETVVIAGVAATIGLVMWHVTMATAPRYSYGPDEDLGNSAVLLWGLLAAAVVGELLVPGRAFLIGLMLGLPGFVLSPWTAPRGDNDGLWLIGVPFLGLFALFLAATAWSVSWLRRGRRSPLAREDRRRPGRL